MLTGVNTVNLPTEMLRTDKYPLSGDKFVDLLERNYSISVARNEKPLNQVSLTCFNSTKLLERVKCSKFNLLWVLKLITLRLHSIWLKKKSWQRYQYF